MESQGVFKTLSLLHPCLQIRSAVHALWIQNPICCPRSVRPKSDLLSSSVRPKSGLLPPSTLMLALTLSEWDTAITALLKNGHKHVTLSHRAASHARGQRITLPAFSCSLQNLRPKLLPSRGVTWSPWCRVLLPFIFSSSLRPLLRYRWPSHQGVTTRSKGFQIKTHTSQRTKQSIKTE